MSKIAVVVLNYNTLSLLQSLLPVVVKHSPEAEVFLIDNASTDESAQWVEENIKEITVIKTPENLGYAGGYNYGLNKIHAEYFVLLNSDAEPSENWLQPLLKMAEENTKIAAIQPKLLDFFHREKFEYAGACGGWIDKYGFPFCRGRIFGNVEQDFSQYNDAIPTFWATGAALFIRKKAWQEAEGLDVRFFAHMEEIDLCWRLQNLGWQIWVNPESIVFHMGGATLKNQSPHKTFLNFRNGLYMLQKNLPPQQAKKVIIQRKLFDALAAFLFLLQGKFAHIKQIIKAHKEFERTKAHFLNESSRKNSITDLVGVLNKSLVFAYFIFWKKTYKKIYPKNLHK